MRLEFLSIDMLWFLLIIPLFIAIHLFMLDYYKGKAIKFSNFEALARVNKGRAGGGFGSAINKDLFVLSRRVIILLILVLAVTQPVFYYEGKTSGFDYVLALDNSLSMSANDFSPNRLEASREASRGFLSLVKGSSDVGIISFASTPVILQEVGAIKDTTLDSIVLNSAGGTSIGDAIIVGTNLLNDYSRGKAIILLTDGQNNVGATVEKAILYAKEKNVVVHTIGVGSSEGGLLDSGVISTLNEEDLRQIATETKGTYLKVTNNEELTNIFTTLVTFNTAELHIILSYWLLFAGFLLLLLEWLFFGTFYKVVH